MRNQIFEIPNIFRTKMRIFFEFQKTKKRIWSLPAWAYASNATYYMLKRPWASAGCIDPTWISILEQQNIESPHGTRLGKLELCRDRNEVFAFTMRCRLFRLEWRNFQGELYWNRTWQGKMADCLLFIGPLFIGPLFIGPLFIGPLFIGPLFTRPLYILLHFSLWKKTLPFFKCGSHLL